MRTAALKSDGIHVTPSKTAKSSGKSSIYEWDQEGILKTVVNECLTARPVDISPYLFCTAKGECYIKANGKANGFDSIWGRFMDRVLNETAVSERFQERDLRAKCATDAESLEHARSLLSHASEATTKRIYRRAPERVKPGKLAD